MAEEIGKEGIGKENKEGRGSVSVHSQDKFYQIGKTDGEKVASNLYFCNPT